VQSFFAEVDECNSVILSFTFLKEVFLCVRMSCEVAVAVLSSS
jgi:hypothetical protein